MAIDFSVMDSSAGSQRVLTWDQVRLLDSDDAVRKITLEVTAGELAVVYIEKYMTNDSEPNLINSVVMSGDGPVFIREKYYVSGASDIQLDLIASPQENRNGGQFFPQDALDRVAMMARDRQEADVKAVEAQEELDKLQEYVVKRASENPLSGLEI